jgi:nitrate reductase delta subunit
MTAPALPLLKILSALLCYPEADLLAALAELVPIIEQEPRLSPESRSNLLDLIRSWQGADLLDLQEAYVALFDRGRSLSLHLFEHVHGESRDRGQAMVDLLQLYQSHGYELDRRELPDYVPLFLEFLSCQPRDQAMPVLSDAMPVLSLLGARLKQRGSPFHAVFDALAEFAGTPENLAEIQRQAAAEGPDETLLRMDEIWEEEAVSFLGSQAPCSSPPAAASPIVVRPRRRPAIHNPASPKG